MKTFDRKFGKEFFEKVPPTPGVYRVFNEAGVIVYVGKAKNLKRRLRQYRNAKRCKAHAKMRKIVKDAASWEWEVTANEAEALLLENRLIRELRPKWNRDGSFWFLYPVLGIRQVSSEVTELCWTTVPDQVEESEGAGFEWYGAFRSRGLTGEAFFGLMNLLSYVSFKVKEPLQARKRVKYSYFFKFRRLDGRLAGLLREFFRGSSPEFLAELSLAMLEHPRALKEASDVQEALRWLKVFFKHEGKPHFRATGGRFVPQRERDASMIRLRQGLLSSDQNSERRTVL